MHSRWPPAPVVKPSVSRGPAEANLGVCRQNFFPEELPDLELQLSAALGGAAWAVVRFVPEDAPWCDWIYRALNGYPLPASLVERANSQGLPRPDCLSIFPDRQDPAHEENMTHALETSAHLIVVCSPHSAGAASLDADLRAFKKAGGEERIIALVVDRPPEAASEQSGEAATGDWLPAWLRWRCDEKGICAADRSEPRVIDARRGFRNLSEVRDELLAALIDVEIAELARLGGCKRPLPVLSQPVIVPPTMTPSFSPPLLAEPAPASVPAHHRDAAVMIGVAVMLIVIAAIFGVKSFRELSADEPASALALAPRAPVAPRPLMETLRAETESAAEPVAPLANEAVVLGENTTPAIPVPSAVAAAPMMAAPSSNVPQLTPSQISATTLVRPAAPAVDDAVLLDEVVTLERRGDEIMAERRTEDALDLYSTALDSAVVYAARKGANPAAKDHVVMLTRKLGLLQSQNASTAEARASYQKARKILLQLKAQGAWNRERARALDDMESRLLTLPRE